MSRHRSSIRIPTLLSGAAVGAGIALIASQRFRKHPEYLPANIRRRIALDRALHRARQAGAISLTGNYRYVIFSDHHKGGRDQADDFQPCEPAYLTALDYYLQDNYTLIILGDAEELWEESLQRVMDAYANVFRSEARFYPDRYLRLSGNHDNAWEIKDLVRQHLDPFFSGIQIRQELLFDFEDEPGSHSEILLLHGHQGTLDGDVFDFVPPHILPLYRQFQNKTGLGRTSPSRDAYERSVQDNQMYYWASQQEKLVLIAGHTHRPIWGSMSHLERLMAQFHALLHTQPQPANFESEAALMSALGSKLASGQDRGGITRAAKRRKRTSCCPTDLRAGPTPIPRQQFVEFLEGMFGDAGQDIGKPGLRVDVVHLGRDDQAVHNGGALAAAI